MGRSIWNNDVLKYDMELPKINFFKLAKPVNNYVNFYAQ